MAQWNLTDRTLVAKLVYYGPALGGKTTNLQRLHALTDPDGRESLVSVNTADDRTLFFDLLPLDLGRVLGYRVAMKLFTVPGQVRYGATRRVVLSAADAVVFVADSAPGREDDNRQSWHNLRLDLRANRLDPRRVPVVVQLNKRDLAHATPAPAMENWFLPSGERAVPAIATRGVGVVETFVAASRAMLERLVALAEPATRRSLDTGEIAAQIERAMAPLLARSRPEAPEDVSSPAGRPIVLRSEDPLENAIAGGVELGSRLADAQGRADRLEREAEALRRLSDALRISEAAFERDTVVDAVLDAAVTVVGASVAALVTRDPQGRPVVERSRGTEVRSLIDSDAGRRLAAWMAGGAGTHLALDALAAAFEVDPERRVFLLIAVRGPDRRIGDAEVRFLGTVGAHLAAGLEKVRVHGELAAHRDRLERSVRARTLTLKRVYDDLKAAEETKDRVLSSVSHEMRTPLTAIIGAAAFLRDYDGKPSQRREMAATILEAASALEARVAAVLRVAQIGAAGKPVGEPIDAAAVVTEALRLAGGPGGVRVLVDPATARIAGDLSRLARAVANLVDNARKFGPSDARIELRVVPCTLDDARGSREAIALCVLDRGPGLAAENAERAFEPFEQGGDLLTGKPRGIGLGLFEAKTIARQHGGSLIYLPRPGRGSEFRIVLPAAATEAGARERAHA